MEEQRKRVRSSNPAERLAAALLISGELSRRLWLLGDSEIAQLKQARAVLSGNGAKKAATPATPKKRKMSAAARKRIGDAQRKRWAKQKASK